MPNYVYKQSAPAPGHSLPSQPTWTQQPTVYHTTETTESSLRCYCPWSLIVLALGVSALVSGIINLVITNWIWGGILTGVGVILALLGWTMWRKDQQTMQKGGAPSGPFDSFAKPTTTTTTTRSAPRQISAAQPQPQVIYVQQPVRNKERSGSVKA